MSTHAASLAPAIRLSESIAIQGAAFAQDRLTIAPDATPKQLGLIGDFLSTVSGACDWWRTDYIHTLHTRNIGHTIEQASFDFYSSVAAIFPPDVRIDGLSFDQHKEAMIGTNGSATEARLWLGKALAESWDVPTLRKHLRLANATYHADERKPTGNGYSALTDAERWARTQEKQLQNYTPERARAILSDIKHLCSLIDTLETIATTAH